VGYCPNEGFEYEASKALTADESQFVGLPLDDENQFEETDARIQAWCQRLQQDYGFPS
jgi:flavodoxin II